MTDQTLTLEDFADLTKRFPPNTPILVAGATPYTVLVKEIDGKQYISIDDEAFNDDDVTDDEYVLAAV